MLPCQLLHPEAQPPQRTRAGDAAYDLRACQEAVIPAGGQATIHTGIALAIPLAHVGLIVPRSGLGSRPGLILANTVGVIDSGYRGEVLVEAWLRDPQAEEFLVRPGDRIAQLLILPLALPEVVLMEELLPGPDQRGAAGFGSSGL